MKRLMQLELLRLMRTARARAVAALLLLATLFAGGLGTTLTQRHRQAAEDDLAAAQARLKAKFEQGASPLEVARWTDCVLPRAMPVLAALSAGNLDALSDVATVRLGQAPQGVPARAERSPASALLGTFDIAWLLSLLLPLAILGLAHDRFAFDRSRGNLAMLMAFAPSPTGLVIARTSAVAAVIALGVLPGLGLSMLGAALYLGEALHLADALAALLLCASAIFAWSAAFVALSAWARQPAQALSMGLSLWAAWAVVIPLAASALGQLTYPDPDPRAELEALQASQELADKDAERWVQAEVKKSPNLDPEDAIDGVESNLRFDLLLSRAQLRRNAGARYASKQALQRRAELARLAAYLSPSTIVSHGLASLGEADPEARSRFEARAAQYQSQLDLHAAQRLQAHDTKVGTLKAWPPADAKAKPDRWPSFVGIVLLWAISLGALLAARQRLTRGAIDPGSETS